MNRLIITIILIIQIPFCLIAQNDKTFEIQAEKVDSSSNPEIQAFYKKFNLWIESIRKDSVKIELDEETMINDFILFSEDGLLMKDLAFHSVESCKKRILMNIPSLKTDEKKNNWLYVSLESHVNKSELIEILTFLKAEKIDYRFGKEDDFVQKIMKK